MSAKGISNIDNFSSALKERGFDLPKDAVSAIIDVACSPLLEEIRGLKDIISRLNETVATLNDINSSTEKSMKIMSQNLEALMAKNKELEEKLRESEAKNNRNSSNSNKPSSWDHFAKPSPKKSVIFSGGKEKRKKSSGGQKGHKGATMNISDRPDKIVDVCPGECRMCPRYRECLASSTVRETRSVVDIELKSVQTDYQLRQFRCPNDGKLHLGLFPEGVSSRLQYGPMTKAVVTDLSADGAMSMKRIKVFMNTLFGFSMSDGTVRNMVAKAAKLGKDFVAKAKKAVSGSYVVHFDETGCRHMGHNAWFHMAATRLFSIFGFHKKRGKEGIESLGVYTGMKDPSQVAVTDFWSSYLTLDGDSQRRHAFCIAHLDRELQDLIDNYGNPACARKMQKLLKDAYIKVQKLKAKGLESADQAFLEEVSRKYDRIVTAALNKYKKPKKTGKKGRPSKGRERALFERFRDYKKGVLMFLHDFEVPASNNTAELCAKGLKSKLKVSECFRGATGPDDFCIVKSILESSRKHGLNHLEILRDLFSGKDISPSFSL